MKYEPQVYEPDIELLQTCDLCGEYFDLQQVRWTGCQMLCDDCLYEEEFLKRTPPPEVVLRQGE